MQYLPKHMEQFIKKHCSNLPWRTFWLTFFAVFILVMLQRLGLRVPQFHFKTEQKVDILSVVRKKLVMVPNSYTVKQDKPLIEQTYAASDYDKASSYALIDYDSGDVILSKSLEQEVPIASLTKMMTAVVSLDLANPSDEFIVTQKAAATIPTKIVVVPGQKMNLNELLHAALMTSANDAVEVIREGVDQKYDDKIFIKAMNVKAQYIGLKNTHFSNPQGFDASDNYSTAEDMAVLAHYAMTHYPLISEIVNKDFLILEKSENHKQFNLYNWNGLLGVYPGISGVKIGNTDDAKMTTLVISERDGKKLIAVMLGAPGVLERDLWTAQLLDAGFEKVSNLPPVAITKEQLYAKYDTWKYWN